MGGNGGGNATTLEMSGGKDLGLIGTFLAERGPAIRRSGTLHVGSTASGAEMRRCLREYSPGIRAACMCRQPDHAAGVTETR